MKMIFIYADRFAYSIGTSSNNEMEVQEDNNEIAYENVQTAFIHVEEKDEVSENTNKLITKLIKQAKWVARKNDSNHIILHSFAHLADSKSSAEFAKEVFDSAQERLENAGFIINQTPFGHFLNLDLKAPGRSLARVYYQID